MVHTKKQIQDCHTFRKPAWLKKTCRFVISDNICKIALQVIFWQCFYVVWHNNTGWRFFSDPAHERISLVFVITAIYSFYFVYQRFYKKQQLIRFFSISLLILISAIAIEYFYVIPTIISHIRTDIFTEQEYINIKQNRQYETWSKISLRDFALFSIVGFSLVYKDTLKYNKLLKAHINTQKEKERLQKDMQSYLAHDHFTKDILNLYIHAHPESQKDMQECIHIYNYSYTHSSCVTCPLDEEIEFAQQLIAFYQKYHPDTPVSVRRIGGMPNAYIMPLSTEPLITNMFKHGVTGPQGNMSIEFDFSIPNLIRMRFTNRISHRPISFDNTNHHGLSLLIKRLNIVYKGSAAVQQTVQDDSCIFTLTIHP